MAKEALHLRAARIAAGYLVGKDAALALGIPFQTYRNVENGSLTPGKALVSAAISRLGVTEAFIRTGRAATAVDELAARIADVIEQYEGQSGLVDPGELAERLKEMRLEAGYKTPSSAAKGMGWAVPTYSSHEAGQNVIPVERQVGYALSFGFRPEYAVLGILPKRSKQNGAENDWRDLRARDAVVPAPSITSWQWLRGSQSSFPVITWSDGRIHVLEQRLSIPAKDPVDGLRAVRRVGLYVFLPADTPSLMYLVDPLGSSGPTVACGVDGRVIISEAGDSQPDEDPVQATPVMSPRTLGRLAAKIRLHIDFT